MLTRRGATFLLATAIMMAMFIGLAPVIAQAGEDGSSDGPMSRPNVPQLINEKLDLGEIDESTALKYKILWFKRSDLLPQEFKVAFDVTVRCATPVVMEIDRNFDVLSPEDRKWLAEVAGFPNKDAIFARPAHSLTLQSSLIPLRVHYESADQQQKAEYTLQAYEESWAQEVGVLGFIAPPGDFGAEGSDDYDVYLSSTGPGVLGYTAPEGTVESTWWKDRASYIVNSKALTSFRNIATTSSHEFNHACQFATAYEETIAFFENCATWVEPHVYYEYADDAWGYAYYFQHEPWRAICGFDDTGLFQYGGFMWPEFFEERINGWDPDLMPQVWEWCRDHQDDSGNQNHYFDAFLHFANQEDPAGPDGDGWDLHDLLMVAAEWRYFSGMWLYDDDHFTYGEEFAQVSIDAEHRHTTFPAVCPDALPNAPQFFGVNYIRLDEAVTNETNLKIFFHGEENWGSNTMIWKIILIKYYTVGSDSSVEYFDVPADTQSLWIDVDEVDQCERLVFAVCNMGWGNSIPAGNFPTSGYYYVVWNEENPPTSLILTGAGPNPNNEAQVRSFLTSDPEIMFSERDHFSAYGYGTNVATGDLDGDGVEDIVAGTGPGPDVPPTFRAYKVDGLTIPSTRTNAYGVEKWGVNVACGDIDGDGFAEIVTGPGPGTQFGPHVRGWNHDGDGIASMGNVSFLAYGTNKYGANVACGDIDGDGIEEIVTGAGPGAAFGPHVRGWNHDGGAGTTPIPGLSFFAYGTPRWGVNVKCGDIDGDGIDEIITGPGPGSIYGPHVRGFNFDGSALQPMPQVSYMAYGTFKYGVHIETGDLDGDGIDEIITGPGPGAVFGAHVRGWNTDGGPITAMSDINFFAYPYDGEDRVRHGCNVAVAEMNLND